MRRDPRLLELKRLQLALNAASQRLDEFEARAHAGSPKAQSLPISVESDGPKDNFARHIAIGSRKAGAAKPARTSLAQFSRKLTLNEPQGGPDHVTGTADGVGESVSDKRFAADVVVAMSGPAVDSRENGTELSKRKSKPA
jgi:hypothetical protein